MSIISMVTRGRYPGQLVSIVTAGRFNKGILQRIAHMVFTATSRAFNFITARRAFNFITK